MQGGQRTRPPVTAAEEQGRVRVQASSLPLLRSLPPTHTLAASAALKRAHLHCAFRPKSFSWSFPSRELALPSSSPRFPTSPVARYPSSKGLPEPLSSRDRCFPLRGLPSRLLFQIHFSAASPGATPSEHWDRKERPYFTGHLGLRTPRAGRSVCRVLRAPRPRSLGASRESPARQWAVSSG